MRVRHLMRNKGLVVAGFVLAMAVALAGSAVGLIWRLFVSPLDVDRPDRLFVARAIETDGDIDDLFSALQYRALADAGALSRFDAAGAIGYQTVDMETTGSRLRVSAAYVSLEFFQVLARPIRRGRGFLASDFGQGGPSVAILSDFFWRTEFNARSTVLGEHISIGGVDVTVVGIAAPGVVGTRLDVGPAAFLPMPLARTTLPHRPELWPPAPNPLTQERLLVSIDWLTVVVRLAARDTHDTAERGLNKAVANRSGTTPTNVARLLLVPLLEAAVPVTSKVQLTGAARLLLTVSVALLVLGAATLALVALREVEARRVELATRLALGGTRTRVVAAITGEVFLIGLCAVGLAFPLSWAIMATAAGVLLPGGVTVGFLGLTLSVPTALGILATGSIAATVALAVVTPAVFSYTRDGALLGARLNEGRLIAPRLRSAVVALLASLALALLGGAVFSLRAVSRNMAVDVGHQADRVLYATFDLRAHKYAEADAREFVTSLITRSLLSPVVKNASVQFRAGGSVDSLYVDGQQQSYRGFFPVIAVDPSYFDVLRLRPVSGRGFVASDSAGQEPVAIVSASVAEAIAERNGLRLGSDVVGHQLLLGVAEFRPTTIVGVVENWVRDPRDLTGRAIYLLARQHPVPPAMTARGEAGILARPTLVLEVEDVGLAKRAIFGALRAIDPQVSPVELSSTQERLEAAFAIQHLASRVMSVFSAIAVVLAFVSLHVLVRSIGAAKRREIAIRSALGANPLRIARWFVREIGKPMLSAVLLGAFGLWLWFHIMSAHVVGIVASDLGIVAAILGAIGAWALGSAIASGVRAGCRSPAEVLRQE